MQYSEGKKMNSIQSLDAIFQFATEGILVTNDKSEIININPSAEKLFGYKPGELLNKKIEVLIPKRYTEKHISKRDEFHHNPHARSMGGGAELFGAKKDGTEFPVEISLSPYSNSDGKFVVAFILDITIRKEAENKFKNYSIDLEKQVGNRTLILQEAITELEKTKNELKKALDKEKELNELKSRFVSMASHEFRTPLATIMSSLSLVKAYGEQNDKDKQGRHIQKIKNSIGNLTNILNDFLSVSRLEEGKVEYIQEHFEIQQHINEVISEMELFCKQGQKIIYSHSGLGRVLLDKKLIRHILYNLISNAVKFSDENTTIYIKSEKTENELKISVEDKGIGISKADQKYLFQRFFRAKNASNIQGTGLGLNIVENYLELMGGSVLFTSKENEGTTFNLSFPQ